MIPRTTHLRPSISPHLGFDPLVAPPNRDGTKPSETGAKDGRNLSSEELRQVTQAMSALQKLGLGGLDAKALAELAILLANKRNQQQQQQRAQPTANTGGGGMPNTGGQRRSALPKRQFARRRSRPKQSWQPTRTAGPLKNPLKGKDKKTAAFIDAELKRKGSPAAKAKNPTAGEMMVDAGKKYGVDPLILASISAHETGHGKLGVGMRKMLGVSAYDNNPNNINKRFDGLRNQIYKGARTFARLRKKGGATANDSLAKQLLAANRGGWATDRRWHLGVARQYRQLAKRAGSA